MIAITRPPFPTLGAMLGHWRREAPDATATICEGRTLSYAMLDERSDRIANAVIGCGAVKGSVVAILSRNSDVYIEMLFGVAKAGAIAAVLNWRLALPELEAVIEDSRPHILFYEDEFAENVLAIAAGSPGLTLVRLGSGKAPAADYEVLVAQGFSASPGVTVRPEDVAVLAYTSGTTGRPKGVPLTHFAILHGQAQSEAGGNAAARFGDVNLLSTPLFHIAALGVTFGSTMFGGTLVILPDPRLPELIAAVEDFGVTRAVFLPAVMPTLLDAAANGANLSSLRTILYGASAIPEALLSRMIAAFDCGFLQNYGMTEAGSSVTFLCPDDHFPGSTKLASCGQPYPDARIRIARDDGCDADCNEAGEVMIRIPSMMPGYWRQPEATAEAFRDDWYASGDIGYLDSDGYLYICDRKKDMIISGGENIYSSEVEAALTGHPEVERVAVIGVPSEKWGEEVKALVIRRSGSNLSETALTAFARTLIAGYKIPKSIDFVAELPLTSVGKVAKADLRSRYWQGRGRAVN